MTNATRVLLVLAVLGLAAGCGSSGPTAPPEPPATPKSADTPVPAPVSPTPAEVEPPSPAAACRPADGEGTVPPAITIDSITFVVNGLEQVVRDGDVLEASSGDRVQVKELTVCVEPFSGQAGEVCVDIAPLDKNGLEIASEHKGTHMAPVTRGLKRLPGWEDTWTIGEHWAGLTAVVNHWPPVDTEDPACGDNRCEHDDRLIVPLR